MAAYLLVCNKQVKNAHR